MIFVLQRNIAFLALFFMFFPWLSFGLNNSDIQPWSLIFSLLYLLLFFEKKITYPSMLFFFAFICSFFISIAYDKYDFLMLRGVANYFSVFLYFFVYYSISKKYNLLRLVIIFNVIWLFVGALQIIFNASIFDFIVSVRTSDSRGVTGLSPEPTYYGMYLFFISWIVILESDYMRLKAKICKVLVFLNVIYIIFIAKSSMILLFLILIIPFLIIGQLSIKKMVIVSFTLISLITLTYINIDMLEGTRIYNIFNSLFRYGVMSIVSDASVNSRLVHVYVSIVSSLNDFMLPHGFHSFGDKLVNLLSYNQYFFHGQYTNKIMSWFGSVFFELGWFSVFIYGGIFASIYNRKEVLKSICNILFLFLILNSAIPLAFPLISILLASFYAKKHTC